ncbi:hypothetical protein REIS_1299 [Rickettsia endosymbiont of Ixodes scapularis]|nr:hypothetical protein REIS_1299 [Rickettsia endosymbiont of Ixodes scapularis]
MEPQIWLPLKGASGNVLDILKATGYGVVTTASLMSPFGDKKSLAFRRREDIMKLL